MSLTRRVPRPLSRDIGEPRDTRLFVVACDDTYAPQQYFACFSIPRIKVHVVPTTDGTSTAQQVLRRLKEIRIEPEDERWMLLDTDHCVGGQHVREFQAALREAERVGIKVALSRPCFEFWLLLHHIDEAPTDSHATCSSVVDSLRLRTGGYNKRNLRCEDFPLQTVQRAFALAQEIDQKVLGGRIPQSQTSRVYKLWESILRGSALAQLPPELRELKRVIGA